MQDAPSSVGYQTGIASAPLCFFILGYHFFDLFSKIFLSAFIFFDNEEKGKKGSLAYFKDHKSEMNDRFLINFDCVANGNNIIFIAQDKAIGSDEYKLLETSFEKNDKYHLEFCTCKEANSNSDHKSFPKGVACVTCHISKLGILYTPHIHTPKDVVAEIGNVDYLAKNTLSFIRNLL